MKIKTACAVIFLMAPTLAHAQQSQAVFDYVFNLYLPIDGASYASAYATCIAGMMTNEQAAAFMASPIDRAGLTNILQQPSVQECVSGEL